MWSMPRENLVDWATQGWVQATGHPVSLSDQSWLDGPAGDPAGIGQGFFESYAGAHALRVLRGGRAGCFRTSTFFVDRVLIRRELRRPSQTSTSELPSTRSMPGRSGLEYSARFGWALAVLFSRRLQQLNVPLSGLETSRGMTSEVTPVVDAVTNQLLFTAWVRQLVGTGKVIYAGAYSTCAVPGHPSPCVRVVFPLPNGNAIVIMRPVAEAAGSLSLISAGDGFGDPGFYFTVHGRGGVVWARYLRALRESIHVYPLDGDIRADHVLSLWGATFLRLHYRLRSRTMMRADRLRSR
jgi:hypothetical protein